MNEIKHYTDVNGIKVAQVPLANSDLTAKLYEADYLELEALGAGLPWQFKQGQLILWRHHKALNIARLLMDADRGIAIRFVDGNARNLCRDNLIRVAGSSKYRARDRLEPQFKFRVTEGHI
jgi:hypothetical protein